MKKTLARCISFVCILYFRLRYGKNIRWGKNICINWRFSFSGKGTLILADNVNLWAHEEKNRFQTFSSSAEISIGKNSRLNGVLMQCRESIIVGEFCLVGSSHLMDTDFHHSDPQNRWKANDEKKIPTQAIRVGNNVWIAGQSAVLKGVTIGENSVVAFRAVVARDIEKNIVVAGNPAKKIKDL